jgi:starvation-inducible DNA-binding protein
MEANIGLTQKDTKEVVGILNTLLSDQHILYMKLRNYHWNIEGASFLELHTFFEKLYNELEGIIDLTAERIRKLGKKPLGSFKEFLENSNLKEAKSGVSDSKTILEDLLNSYESTIIWMRENIEIVSEEKDYGTEDMLVGIMRSCEEAAWMLRAFLSK